MQLNEDVTTLDPILRAHEQISGYGLVKRRGRGGVAEVWEADSPAGYRVALKLVHLSTDLRSGELRALKITRSIRHPSLLEIFGTWQVENLLVICMELADLSLWDRFLEVSVQGLRGVPRSELLGYLSSVADAIDYLNDYKHSVAGRDGVGVQHRDLKPQNILLLGGRAKVADFGLARVMEQAVASHTGPCTLPYAAPEYFGGKTSRQSDQYALAVTYCQLRGGWMPFHGSTAQITFGHLYNDPDLAGIPAPERPILARALAKRPEERWPDCRSFIDALQELGLGQGDSVPDHLPREQCDLASEQAHKGDSPVPSGLSLNSADSDFIPLDTDDLEYSGFRGGEAGPGVTLSTGASRLDRASGSARFPGAALREKRHVGDDAGRLTAAWIAALRPKLARVIGQVVAQTASGLASMTRRTRSLATRIRFGAAASTARLRPKLTRLIGQVSTLTALVMVTLIHGIRSLATRLRVGVATFTAGLRPKLARLLDRVSALTALAVATLFRGTRSLAARLRVGGWWNHATARIAGLRPKFARGDRVAALTALGLAIGACGIWFLTARSRLVAPSSGTTTLAVTPRETAPPKTLGAASPHRSDITRETPSTTPREPTREAGRPEPPLMEASESVVPTTFAASARVDSPESPATPAASIAAAPAPAVLVVLPRATAPEALALTGPVSMAPAPENLTSLEPATALASRLEPKRIPPLPAPLPSVSDRPKAEDQSTRDVPTGGTDGDPARPHTTPADPVASKVSTPSLTLPRAVSVKAGEATKLQIGVVRGDPSKPAHLDFRGLPRGITVAETTIPAGADTADVVLSASAKSAPGTADVVVVVTAQSQRGEAATRITVLPSPATIACERGQADLSRGAYEEAVTAFSEAIRLEPDSFAAHFHRGIAHYLAGRSREALTDYTSAIRVVPGSAEARLARARVHRDLGNYHLALKDYTDAIRLRPDGKVYVARGCLQHEIGAYDQALADYEIALRLRPDDSAAHFRRGVTRYVMGDSAGAITDFTEVIRHDPKDVGAYHFRSDAFARLGEYAKAGADRDTFERLSHPSGKSVLK
jgi:serine/threonine protein kinase/Flp pilus assembly protein TadD